MNVTQVMSRSTPYNMPFNVAALTTTTTTTGNAVEIGMPLKTFQATLSAGTATVVVDGSFDNVRWSLAVQTLAFASAISATANDSSCFKFYRLRVTAIAGGGTLSAGYCGA